MTQTPKTPDPTIEEHATALQLPKWQFDGAKRRNKWPAQKRMPLKQFQKAVQDWLSGHTAGGKK